jgi:IclR family acetate operon transcriptional repressor
MNVNAADRALRIFEAFADRGAPMTLSELARLLEIPVSTCFNLMRTLEARGYLYEVAGRKSFYPTARWLVKAQAIARHDPVREQLEPFLQSLRDETDETVILGKPMHSTSAGKALLSAMPVPEREKMIAEMRLDRVTGATITQRSRLIRDIEEGTGRGWFASRGENVDDVMGIAAFVNIGGDTFTVTVAGPIHRMDPKVEKHAKRLVATCKAIARGDPASEAGHSKGHAA